MITHMVSLLISKLHRLLSLWLKWNQMVMSAFILMQRVFILLILDVLHWPLVYLSLRVIYWLDRVLIVILLLVPRMTQPIHVLISVVLIIARMVCCVTVQVILDIRMLVILPMIDTVVPLVILVESLEC